MHEYGYFYDVAIKLFLHIFLPHKILETSLMIHYDLDLIQSASFLILTWFKLLVLQIGYCISKYSYFIELRELIQVGYIFKHQCECMNSFYQIFDVSTQKKK